MKKVLEGLIKETTGRKTRESIGKFVTMTIKRRSRQGFGVRNGQRERLKPLSDSYIEKRRRSRLSSKTSVAKSNLTFSGEMLDNLTYEVTDDGVEITFTSADAARKAGWVSDERPFLDITAKEVEQVTDHILTKVKK